jgi:hypothetical protein
MVLVAGGDGVPYICTKCHFIVTSEGAPPATCPVYGTIGGFAVSGLSST